MMNLPYIVFEPFSVIYGHYAANYRNILLEPAEFVNCFDPITNYIINFSLEASLISASVLATALAIYHIADKVEIKFSERSSYYEGFGRSKRLDK